MCGSDQFLNRVEARWKNYSILGAVYLKAACRAQEKNSLLVGLASVECISPAIAEPVDGDFLAAFDGMVEMSDVGQLLHRLPGGGDIPAGPAGRESVRGDLHVAPEPLWLVPPAP